MYETFNKGQLQELYEANRKALGKYNNVKVVFIVLEGSLFRGQLSVLNHYDIDMEVCLSIYSRTYSEWRVGVVESVSLDISNYE